MPVKKQTKTELETFLIRVITAVHQQMNMIEAQIEQLQNARTELLKSKGYYALVFEKYGYDKYVFKEDMEKT